MPTAFENFVNTELPRRIHTDVPPTGNLPSGQYLKTTGVGLGVTPVSLGAVNNIFEEFICDTIAAVYDIVYISEFISNKVIVNADNRNSNLSVGIIIEKLSDTLCNVLFHGLLYYPDGLTKGRHVFLGNDGRLTSIIPSDGYIQTLGFCYKEDMIFFNPSYTRVKRNPF